VHPTSRIAFAALGTLLLWPYAGRAPAADDGPAGQSRLNLAGDALVKALKETPGCLGVETARTASGKAVIFAFFENKKAAMKWFYSPAHRELMESLGPRYEGKRAPMKGVPDDVPVMAVASLTPGKPAAGDVKLPVSQIAIELYTPLTAGLNIGGGFAPDAFRALTPKAPARSATQK
jgi:hypothetical protein